MSIIEMLARRRVTIGFVATVFTLVFAHPSWRTWAAGLVVSLVGEAIRIWAAGHLEKSREVTRSGPYRWTRHPLYAGSSIVALGVAIASRSVIVAAIVFVYMATTLLAAIRTEEAYLRGAFGDAYDRYRDSRAERMDRVFSLSRALRNREHRAVTGLAAGFALLALKVAASL